MRTCIRCDLDFIPLVGQDKELCEGCNIIIRNELLGGQYLLDKYLAKWAAFEDWCAERAAA